MLQTPLYLSRPSIHLSGKRLSNDDVIRKVREKYKGAPGGWPAIEDGIRYVFDRCNSQYRYIEEDIAVRGGEMATEAAGECLRQNSLTADQIGLVINASVCRHYFEPATAMEIAGRLGITRCHALDVTSACVGQMEGIQVASGLFQTYPDCRYALVVSGELTREFLNYELQSAAELAYKAAGLTIGNAAAAWLVGREPFPGGCARLVSLGHASYPEYWHLCQTPIDGPFFSNTQELLKLNIRLIVPELRRVIEETGWTVDEVDHFILHQPGELMNSELLDGLGADAAKYLGTHHLYGNTVSTSVALNMYEQLRQHRLRNGQKLLFGSATAGLTLAALTAIWTE